MRCCLSLTAEVRRDELEIYEKITFNVPCMAEQAGEVTVLPESTTYTHTTLGTSEHNQRHILTRIHSGFFLILFFGFILSTDLICATG